jgi:hypothetical protein
MKCPYCKSELEEDVLKCKFCGEFIHGKHETNINIVNTPIYQQPVYAVQCPSCEGNYRTLAWMFWLGFITGGITWIIGVFILFSTVHCPVCGVKRLYNDYRATMLIVSILFALYLLGQFFIALGG